MNRPAALSVDNLRVQYGNAVAVDDVSLRILEGTVVAVVGANGAGKTTTLNALMGLLQGHGRSFLFGRDLTAVDTEGRAALGLALVPETRALFGSMSVADNLLLGTYLRSKTRGDTSLKHDRESVLDLFPRLRERLGQLAGTLSGGERQMLAIARALLMKPRVLMLDEPSLGLAPLVVKEVLTTVSSLRQLGVSILLVEQNARAALEISDYCYVLENGRVSIEGPAERLSSDPKVTHAYLGSN